MAEETAQGRLIRKLEPSGYRFQIHRRFPQQRFDFEEHVADNPVPGRMPADTPDQRGQVFGGNAQIFGIVRHVLVRGVIFENHVQETVGELLLAGIVEFMVVRIRFADKINVTIPEKDSQQLHNRFPAERLRHEPGPVFQQVAIVQKPPDVFGRGFRCDMFAHKEKEIGRDPPQGTEAVGEHLLRRPVEREAEIAADLPNRDQLPGKQEKDHPRLERKSPVEGGYDSRTRYADTSDHFLQVSRAIGYRQGRKFRMDAELGLEIPAECRRPGFKPFRLLLCCHSLNKRILRGQR